MLLFVEIFYLKTVPSAYPNLVTDTVATTRLLNGYRHSNESFQLKTLLPIEFKTKNQFEQENDQLSEPNAANWAHCVEHSALSAFSSHKNLDNVELCDLKLRI